jgi:hypothetical protein
MSRQEWIKTQFNWPKYMDIFEEILQFRSENPRLFLLAHVNILETNKFVFTFIFQEFTAKR